ncbi:MAG: hypothetical protein RJQ09_02705 [Cyclobacteriaceae bacterium]
MKNEERIIELLAEMVHNQDITNQRLEKLENKMSNVEEGIVKLNLQTSENTRAILKLADEVKGIADINKRVTKLEKAVFK